MLKEEAWAVAPKSFRVQAGQDNRGTPGIRPQLQLLHCSLAASAFENALYGQFL